MVSIDTGVNLWNNFACEHLCIFNNPIFVLKEMGPLTMGFERWANLPPAQYKLQSFGHAAITEEGNLEIKLICIDGSIMFEKTLTAPKVPVKDNTELDTSVASSISISFSLILIVASVLL